MGDPRGHPTANIPVEFMFFLIHQVFLAGLNVFIKTPVLIKISIKLAFVDPVSNKTIVINKIIFTNVINQ